MEEAVEETSVFEKVMSEIFIYSKNTVAVRNRNKFGSHMSGTFHGIFVATGRAETAVTSERDKFQFTTMRTTIHGSAKGWISTMNHFIHVFNYGIPWMQCINHFFIIISKNLLQNIHKTIMKENETKRNPHPSRLRGRGVEVSKTLFYGTRGDIYHEKIIIWLPDISLENGEKVFR